MLENPENNDSYVSEVISSLSSKDRYFLAYYDPKGYYKADYVNMKPYFIVYREENVTTIKDLMNIFLEENQHLVQLKKGMAWELYTGTRLSPKMTLDEFKEGVRTEKIDGIKLFVYERKGEWSDEAAVTTYLTASDEHNQKPIQAPFYIEDVKFYIYLSLTPNSDIAEIQLKLQKEIQVSLCANVDLKSIQIFFKKSETIVPAEDKHLSGFIGSEKQKFIVRFSKKVVLKLPPKQNNTYIIIQGQGILKNIFDYDSIKNTRLIEVLRQLMPNKQLKKIALILEGQLLRWNQSFSKFEKICKNSSTTTKHFMGYLISEGLAFYYSYQQFVDQKIDFQSILIKQPYNLFKRKECDQMSGSRAMTTTHNHFKNTQNVSTILYYTSQLKVHASDSKKESIYCNMNRFMREYDYCDAEILSKENHWQYRFAAHLYSQIKNIKPLEKTILWRGINYITKYKIGENAHFEQFNSTSTSLSQAMVFAKNSILMFLNSKSAHPIKQYSFYQYQDEVLLEPYSTFQVKNIWKLTKETIKLKQKYLQSLDEKTYQQWRKEQGPNASLIDLIILEEIDKPQMPKMKSTVFLWVDDKTGQGKSIWSTIQEIKHTTVMIQLLSTQQLNEWLTKNANMINDPQIEIVMITNMTRVEKGKKEDKAGVYAIDAFYKYKPEGTVFVYIGWVEGTLKKLEDHKTKYIPNEQLIVSSQYKDMVDFLKKKGIQSK